MKEVDYYSVMESKIKYYAKKYDPQNKLKNYAAISSVTNEKLTINPDINGKPQVKGRKWKQKVESVVAMFI